MSGRVHCWLLLSPPPLVMLLPPLLLLLLGHCGGPAPCQDGLRGMPERGQPRPAHATLPLSVAALCSPTCSYTLYCKHPIWSKVIGKVCDWRSAICMSACTSVTRRAASAARTGGRAPSVLVWNQQPQHFCRL